MAPRWLVAPTVLLIALHASTSCGAESAGSTTLTFEDDAAGSAPRGFTTALGGGGSPASWVVRADTTAPSGANVLVQTSDDTTNDRFPLCIYDGVSTADVTLTTKFKALSGTVDQAAGLVWRFQDPGNYYLVRANALEGNVVLYKVERGKRSDLKPMGSSGLFTYGKKAGVAHGRWQTLMVDVRGSRFGVSLDGEKLFDVDDSTFPGAGKVGLWTKADSVTAFDDLRIEPRPSAGRPPRARTD